MMRKFLAPRVVMVLALLAVLISYNYDFECLLESAEQSCHLAQAELSSECTQPSTMPAVVALLPTHTPVTAPAPSIVVDILPTWLPAEPPAQSPRTIPIGLRAPPAV